MLPSGSLFLTFQNSNFCRLSWKVWWSFQIWKLWCVTSSSIRRWKKEGNRTVKPAPYSFFLFFIKREKSKTKLKPNQTKKDPRSGAILAIGHIFLHNTSSWLVCCVCSFQRPMPLPFFPFLFPNFNWLHFYSFCLKPQELISVEEVTSRVDKISPLRICSSEKLKLSISHI